MQLLSYTENFLRDPKETILTLKILTENGYNPEKPSKKSSVKWKCLVDFKLSEYKKYWLIFNF